jgi:hypothetical protein
MEDSFTVRRARIAGRASAVSRKGNSAWGRSMLTRKGFLAQQAAYPTLLPLWQENARRKQKGLPPLPIPSLEPLRRAPEVSEVRVQRGSQGGQA